MLTADCIQYLQAHYDETNKRRGDEYGRFYGLLTAELEYVTYLLDNASDWEDDDIYDTELGVESATVAEDWCEDFIYQILDELYECDTKDKFYAKFTTTCSQAWLYFWDVKYWEEDIPAYQYLRDENEQRWDGDEQPLPQWMLDELHEYDS